MTESEVTINNTSHTAVASTLDANGSLSLLLPTASSALFNISATPHDQVSVSTDGKCSDKWSDPHHMLFQVAHTALLLGFMAPMTTQGLLFFHGTLMLGYLLLSTWAWAVLCSPDVFSWNFSFTFINAVQVFLILYQLRPVKFPAELEEIYETIFMPFRVTRHQFKKLTSSEYCSMMTLHQGEAYATQEVTRTDRLSLLLSGTAHVTANGQFLHHIQEKQFLDSPEFESTTHGDEKFHVSITGASTGRYICWHRDGLEYLFAKEPYLGVVMGHIMGRDITNKLYLLNDKLKAQKGVCVDIRLPNVSVAAIGGIDLRNNSANRHDSLPPVSSQTTDNLQDDDAETELEDHDDDYFINTNEKSTLMLRQSGRKHGSLQQQLSNSTQSSASSR